MSTSNTSGQSSGDSYEQKLAQESAQKFGTRSRKSTCDVKRNEFNDQVDLLSISCGLDLGNPETEIDSDTLKEIFKNKQKDDAEISKLMRESKSWSQTLVAFQKCLESMRILPKMVMRILRS